MLFINRYEKTVASRYEITVKNENQLIKQPMKIVDRKTFMQMPKGTVFCKFPLKNEGDAEHLCVGIHKSLRQ